MARLVSATWLRPLLALSLIGALLIAGLAPASAQSPADPIPQSSIPSTLSQVWPPAGGWGSWGSGNGQISPQAGDMAVDAGGDVYIVDTANHCVAKFASDGQFLFNFGSSGTNYGQFGDMGDIALDSSGNIYVVDTGNNRVQKFDPWGGYQDSYAGTYGDYMLRPQGIAFDPGGNMYVADTGNNKIRKYSKSAPYQSSWGSLGALDGQFGASGGPGHLATDSTGKVYATDIGDYRVLKFSSTGAFVSKFSPSGVVEPRDIAIDKWDNVYVSAPVSGQPVGVFTTSGAFARSYGGVSIPSPSGVGVDMIGNVFLAARQDPLTAFPVNVFAAANPLDHISLGNGMATFKVNSGYVPIAANGYDAAGNLISGLAFRWTLNNEHAGSITNSVGRVFRSIEFLPNQHAAGVYPDVITARYGPFSASLSITLTASDLWEVRISPPSVIVGHGAKVQFSATGYDRYYNQTPPLTGTWGVDTGAGSVDATGAFVASGAPGSYRVWQTSPSPIVYGGATGWATVTIVGAPALTGDVNFDGYVGVQDLVAIASSYGRSSGFDPNEDLNDDGKIDLADLVIMGLNYGKNLGL